MQTALPTDAQVQQALREVYARPELAPRTPGPLDGLGRAVRRVLAAIGEWLGGFAGLHSENPVIFWMVIGALILVGVAIVAYFIRSTLARLDEHAAAPRVRPAGDGVDARARTAGEWEEEARRAAAAGRYREAAVALYQALLLRLEAAGALRYDPAKTPGDYRRETRRAPQAAGALTAFLRGFEPVVFGGRALDAAGYDRLRGAAGEAGAHG
jgi:Domain of unknown function (DUF4129)